VGAPPSAVEFGPFRLDTGKRVLWRDDRIVPLPPTALDVLVALVEEHGDVVTKDALLDRVWPDTFVEEANLSVNISTLRKMWARRRTERPTSVRLVPIAPAPPAWVALPALALVVAGGIRLWRDSRTKTA
jgi:DNA-binding winged helix-turn-helix (wHTH) protein